MQLADTSVALFPACRLISTWHAKQASAANVLQPSGSSGCPREQFGAASPAGGSASVELSPGSPSSPGGAGSPRAAADRAELLGSKNRGSGQQAAAGSHGASPAQSPRSSGATTSCAAAEAEAADRAELLEPAAAGTPRFSGSLGSGSQHAAGASGEGGKAAGKLRSFFK